MTDSTLKGYQSLQKSCSPPTHVSLFIKNDASHEAMPYRVENQGEFDFFYRNIHFYRKKKSHLHINGGTVEKDTHSRHYHESLPHGRNAFPKLSSQ